MLAMWWVTQVDEAFPEAISGGLVDASARIRSKDLIPSDKTRSPKVYVNFFLGHQALRNRLSMSNSIHPIWNEELMFVAAEPFEKPLIVCVEDRVAVGLVARPKRVAQKSSNQYESRKQTYRL
ncbi:putative C2 domain-containing protein [Helianthus anomalus]